MKQLHTCPTSSRCPVIDVCRVFIWLLLQCFSPAQSAEEGMLNGDDMNCPSRLTFKSFPGVLLPQAVQPTSIRSRSTSYKQHRRC